MDPVFGFGKNSFSRPRSSVPISRNMNRGNSASFCMLEGLREGDIVAVSGSESENSSDEYERIKVARLQRMRGRDIPHYGITAPTSQQPSSRADHWNDGYAPNRMGSGSIRLHQFSDMSFEDDEDLDFPPPIGGISGDSFYVDRDPYKRGPAEDLNDADTTNKPDLVDLDAETSPQRFTARYAGIPIPPLAEVMARFKLKVASKKAEISDAQDLREQTAQRIRSLQEELVTVKAKIEAARKRYDILEDQALPA